MGKITPFSFILGLRIGKIKEMSKEKEGDHEAIICWRYCGTSYLPYLKQAHRPQVTIVNAENAADGRGLTEKLYKQILSLGVEAITLGNHAFDNRDLYNFIEGAKPLVRPANLPATTPGKGIHYVRYNQYQVAVINVLGTVFMNPVTSPFLMIDELVDQARKQTPFIFVDCHAEATSEKLALAHYLDGRVSGPIPMFKPMMPRSWQGARLV